MTTAILSAAHSRVVTPEDLLRVEAPEPTATWFPVKHATVLQQAEDGLNKAGFIVEKRQLALARHDHHFFGTLDLATPLATGVKLSVGVRNSTDKTIQMGFCAGTRVFVCSNLAFRSEIVIARKHTRNGQERFAEALCEAVKRLGQFQEAEARRIKRMQLTEVDASDADSLILRAYEKKIISSKTLPLVLGEWRHPSFEEFEPRTLWSLYNAFTTAMGPRQRSNPQEFAKLTIDLGHHLGQVLGETLEPVPVLSA